jgi:hypothetical protein
MFGWLKRKSIEEALHEPTDKVILHEHDLSKWNYLGYREIRFVDDNKVVTERYPIFLFADKENDKRRSYYISGNNTTYVETYHSYVAMTLKPWAAGEGPIYILISGDNACPSDYLKEYMLERFSAEWDTATNWWGSSDDAKYTSASNKQKRERKPKEVKAVPESNVVTVEFGKQA